MMRSLRAFLAVALIALPLATSCSEVQAPEASNVSTSIERQDGLITDLLGGVVGGVLSLVDHILTGPDANGSDAYAWIGSAGGTVQTAAYTLVVPRGAVSEKTKFVVEPENNGTYTVNLYAYRQGLLGLIDVGGKGFKKPVLLTIRYANAEGVTDERKLTIIYLSTSSAAEVQPSIVDRKDKEVTAQLPHFSKYAMAQN